MSARYWFPAKRYGWGWGLPSSWEGWVVLAAFIVSLVAASLVFPPTRDLPAYIGSVVGLAVLFVAVCWWKGAPPRWRWGEDDRSRS